jgi:hypothetical protein
MKRLTPAGTLKTQAMYIGLKMRVKDFKNALGWGQMGSVLNRGFSSTDYTDSI